MVCYGVCCLLAGEPSEDRPLSIAPLAHGGKGRADVPALTLGKLAGGIRESERDVLGSGKLGLHMSNSTLSVGKCYYPRLTSY